MKAYFYASDGSGSDNRTGSFIKESKRGKYRDGNRIYPEYSNLHMWRVWNGCEDVVECSQMGLGILPISNQRISICSYTLIWRSCSDMGHDPYGDLICRQF